MNPYGRQAMEHWRTWLPNRYASIPDPQTFFAELGEQAEHQVQDLWDQLQAADPPSRDERQDYLATVGRLNALQQMAEGKVLSESVLLPPEADLTRPPPQQDPARDHLPAVDPTGMPRDRDHPLWRMAEDDSVSPEDFRAAANRWEQDLNRT